MAKINVRNRNRDQYYKDGRPKPPNWEYRFEGAKIEGKRNHISKAGFRTKKEAEVAGAKAYAEFENAGLRFEPSEVSVSDYLDYWLDNYCKANVADSTMVAYKNIIKTHLKPRIGHYKLKAVNTLILQEMLNDIALHRGFSKSFVKNILKVLKGSFKYAFVTARLIKTNPAEYVTLPNMPVSSNPEEIIILTRENVNRILERFRDSPAYYYAALTAYYTGLRVSEVYGLTWDCVDFDNKKITVNKIVKKIEVDGKVSESGKRGVRGKSTTKFYFGECKTPTSYRTVDIGDTLLNALKEYKKWQEECEADFGEFYIRHYLRDEISAANRQVQRILPMLDTGVEIPLERTYPVFIKENGEFRGSDTPKYMSKVINYELGIHYNFHAFRHTHATMLVEAGTPIKAISERLGHANVRTTLETYVHVTDNMKTDAVDRFETVGNLEATGTVISFNDLKRTVSTKSS